MLPQDKNEERLQSQNEEIFAKPERRNFDFALYHMIFSSPQYTAPYVTIHPIAFDTISYWGGDGNGGWGRGGVGGCVGRWRKGVVMKDIRPKPVRPYPFPFSNRSLCKIAFGWISHLAQGPFPTSFLAVYQFITAKLEAPRSLFLNKSRPFICGLSVPISTQWWVWVKNREVTLTADAGTIRMSFWPPPEQYVTILRKNFMSVVFEIRLEITSFPISVNDSNTIVQRANWSGLSGLDVFWRELLCQCGPVPSGHSEQLTS